MSSHLDTIRDQFTRQAEAFSTAPAIQDADALGLLLELARAGPEDTVLDVASGPGLVVCAFAPVVRHATGIDLTPAMIERSHALAAEKGLRNVTFRLGEVPPLPYPDASFSIVASRYAFHHFEDPWAVFLEEKRVLRPGGRLLLVDVMAPDDPRQAEAYNRMEKLRDPSHVRAMPLAELAGFYARAGLPAPRAAFYSLEVELDGLLSRSCPAPGGAAEIRRMFEESLGDDGLGMATRRVGSEIHARYPIAALAAER